MTSEVIHACTITTKYPHGAMQSVVGELLILISFLFLFEADLQI